MSNRLAQESSPYLLQHADNPVDWYPWSDEALEKARAENKPILLSIGYAACHWCHVMAHESFEDDATAAIMNEHFVNVKVDREERPDLDSIYMSAVVAMTGQGGWPMTVFLTPDGHPFYGGTYYPPVPRFGMPSFRQVLESVARAWETQEDEIIENAGQVAAHLGQRLGLMGQDTDLQPAVFDHALQALRQSYDGVYGGWGDAPKFPQAMTIEFLLRMVVQRDGEGQEMAAHTLEMMAGGGMYDHLGGGFARYSTDSKWLVPHFEKMLYDNALLARAYVHGWQVTGHERFREVVEETLDWVVGEMRHEDGGFYSSLDADSEGEEGKFYVWNPGQIREALPEDDARLFIAYYDVSEGGNWEGKSILNTPRELADVAQELGMDPAEARERLESAREVLYDRRAARVWPGRDEKVLTAWNGLMMAAFAEAGRVLGRDDYVQVARDNARFLYGTLRSDDGRLLRTWKVGSEARYNGYLEDYAYLAEGLLTLYQTTFEEQWFAWAEELAQMMLDHFRDEQGGGFYDTSDDHEELIHRPKDVQDNAVPSGNAMAATVLLSLGLFTGKGHYWDVAQEAVAAMSGAMAQYPTGFAQWLTAATLVLGDPREVAIVGEPEDDDVQALLDVTYGSYRPLQVVAVGRNGDTVPLLRERTRLDDRATAYVCRQFVCQRPVAEPAALQEQLAGEA
ncbi:MAG TPA: thioredoxin domain-containing protein [Candidatus Sulfomarinibacteraceae bacterium]|nr:thioredoxin domain-containing protein [Candidatus Sulfomarinibacteraceae bacterium]